MKKRVLISTGGSGGHVVPGTIFYDHLKYEFEMFMTSDYRGIKFLDENKYNTKILDIPKLSKNIFSIPIQFFSIIYSIYKSILFLKREKIEILISTGGYMSLPLCLASKFLNVKLFLFEPNMVLGRSNKFFISYCEKIFCYTDNVKNLPVEKKNKISLIPALLRKKFYKIDNTNVDGKEINLLIIGGSQGAKLFDKIIKNSIINLSKNYKLKIFQQTNKNNFDNLRNFYQKNKINNELFDFDDNICDFMKKTNICLTRAGASTLAELVFLNVPHIAIPLPTAKDNHQLENATFYNQKGCNWILNQNEMNDDILTNRLISIINNKEERQKKKLNMKKFNYENTWNNINQKIISTINEN
jgi:UDP-N-acetylglucosamine--N-acetylmuramyl-(pentapeptide) pyrophosphoryl-undecaprenol N-acetylglucosamine transferase